jgi:hypothetical protein
MSVDKAWNRKATSINAGPIAKAERWESEWSQNSVMKTASGYVGHAAHYMAQAAGNVENQARDFFEHFDQKPLIARKRAPWWPTHNRRGSS